MKNKKVFWTTGCILRNEGSYILEWVTFLHLIGCDRLICVLHQCDDNTQQQLECIRYNLGMDIRIHHCKTLDGKVQMGVYQWIHQQYGKDTEWLLFLDGDEYVYNVNPTINYQNDIKEMLSEVSNKVSAVSFCSKVFGPNRNITKPNYRLTAYLERLPLNSFACSAIKTFIRPKQMIRVLTPHYQQVKGQTIDFNGNKVKVIEGWRTQYPIHSPICFNHYYTGSVEDWLARYRRGSCNDLRPNQAYSLDEFMYHTYNMEQDSSILRYKAWHKILIQTITT